MKKFFKWAGLIVGSHVGLIALALGVVYLMSEAQLNKVYDIKPAPVTIPTDAASVAEGQRLFATRGCGDCHKGNGAGGDFIDDPLLGRISAANLTGGQGSRSGSFSDNDWVRAIRHGVGPDGSTINPTLMPWPNFAQMSDTELSALWLYLQSVPAKPEGQR